MALTTPSWEEMMNEDPLVAFSRYLSGRLFCMRELGSEVLADLDAAFTAIPMDGGRIERAEAKTWFWILGAYEIVRTMSQAKTCFSAAALSRIDALEEQLEVARMPAANMEPHGHKHIAVISNRSPAKWDIKVRDLLVDNPGGSLISSRGLIAQFNDTVTSIRSIDVIKLHELSYGVKA